MILILGCPSGVMAEETPTQRQVLKRLYELGDAETDGKNVILVSFYKVSDKDFAVLKHVPHVKYLDCGYSNTDGSGLVHVKQMRQLEILYLHGNRIKDKNLKYIVNLPKLRRIDLEDTPVSDKGLQYLARISSLEAIHLGQTNVTDRGLHLLRKLKRLRGLDLNETRVSRNAVENLKRALPKIRVWYSPRRAVEARKPVQTTRP